MGQKKKNWDGCDYKWWRQELALCGVVAHSSSGKSWQSQPAVGFVNARQVATRSFWRKVVASSCSTRSLPQLSVNKIDADWFSSGTGNGSGGDGGGSGGGGGGGSGGSSGLT